MVDKKQFAVVGAGFIGKHLIRTLLAMGHPVSVLDRHNCPDEFIGNVSWIVGDYHDKVRLGLALAGSATAYHLVSSTVPGDQHADVANELHENVVGSLRFMDACVAARVMRIVFASSASVYGVQDHFPINESAPTNPISAHGIHKLAVEKYLGLAHRIQGLDVRIMRLANPYGPGQSLVGRQGFIAIAIGCLLHKEPLILRDGGSMVRDFVYVEDLATAMALGGLLDDLPQVINIGAGEGHTLREVLTIIELLAGQRAEVSYADARIVDIPVSVMDIRLAQAALGFSPQTGLYEGIGKTLLSHGFQLLV